MIDKIQELYEIINNEFISMSPFGHMNNKNYRAEFKQRLEKEIVNSFIKCDEENNPPEVVDFCCLVARVSWTENHQNKYCDLIFGQLEQVMMLQHKLLTN